MYNRELHNNIYQNFCLIFILFKDQVSIFINEAERDDHEAKMKIIKQEKAEKKTNREDEVENQSEITNTNNRETFKNFFSDEDINEVSLILLGPTKSNTDIVVFEGKLKNIEEDLEYFFDEYAYEYIEKLDLKNYKKTINNHENIIDFFGIENNIPKGILYI